jgi:hypothetical protein
MTVGNDFLVGGLGVELQPEKSLPSPFSRNLLFWDIEPNRQLLIKPETDDKLKKIAYTSATFPLDLLKNSVGSASFGWQKRAHARACAKLRTYF